MSSQLPLPVVLKWTLWTLVIVGSSLQLPLHPVLAVHVEENLLGNLGLELAEVTSVDEVPHVRSLHVMLHHQIGFCTEATKLALFQAEMETLILLLGVVQIVLETLDCVHDSHGLVFNAAALLLSEKIFLNIFLYKIHPQIYEKFS